MNQNPESPESAFRALFQRYQQTIYSFGLYLTKSTLFAEKIVTDTYLQAWKQHESLTDNQFISPWLKTVARNVAMEELQKFAQESMVLERIQNLTQSISNHGGELYIDLEIALQEALNALAPRRRQAYLLSREYGLSYTEVAKQMNISKYTAADYLKETRAALRKQLDGHILQLVTAAMLATWK